MINFPIKKGDVPQQLRDLIIRTADGDVSADKAVKYKDKSLDYRTLPICSSKFYIYEGKYTNDYISSNYNTVWIRWKDRIVIVIEGALTVGDKVNVHVANIIEHETFTGSGSASGTVITSTTDLTTTDFFRKFVYVSDVNSPDYLSIYKIASYDSGTKQLTLVEKLNADITADSLKIVDKVIGSTYYWKDVEILDDYTNLKNVRMGDSNLGIFNTEPGPASSFDFPLAITKTGVDIFYLILDNTTLIPTDELFKNIEPEDIKMESSNVAPGQSILDIFKEMPDAESYENTAFFFNQFDQTLSKWKLYSFHKAGELSITSISSVFTGGRYYLDAVSSELIATQDDYYLVYEPYYLVYKGTKQDSTTVRFSEVVPYNFKGDVTNNIFFSKLNIGIQSPLMLDYLRLNSNFVIFPQSGVSMVGNTLYIQNLKICFIYGNYTESAYTTSIDLSGLANGEYVLRMQIKNGSSNNIHIISVVELKTATDFQTNRLSTYGDSYILGIIKKTGSLYYLSLFGKYMPDFSTIKLRNQIIDNTVVIGNHIKWDHINSKWIKTPVFKLPHGICEDPTMGNIVLSGKINIPGLAPGETYYTDNVNAGELSLNDSSDIVLGTAFSTNELMINICRVVKLDSAYKLNQSLAAGVTTNIAVEYDASSDNWKKAVANTIPFGICDIDNRIVSNGLCTLSGLTPDTTYYMSTTTDGAITTIDTSKIIVGKALTASLFMVRIIKGY